MFEFNAPIAELTLKYTFLIATNFLAQPTTVDLITIVQCVKEMPNSYVLKRWPILSHEIKKAVFETTRLFVFCC